ncbi:MAG: hypothetical protein ABSA58_01755 [Acetobacteraceae bacterium]
MVHRFQRLLTGARRFFGAGSDLIRGFAHFCGGRGSLGNAAGELRCGSGYALGRLLLTGKGPRLAFLRLSQRRIGGDGCNSRVIVAVGEFPCRQHTRAPMR